MKLFFLLLTPLLAWCWSPYTWGTKLRLDNGADRIKLIHTVDGVAQDFSVVLPLPLEGAAYQKITIWPVAYRQAKAESTCGNPCELGLPLHYGSAKLRAEYFDVSGNLIRTGEWMDLPQAQGPCEASYTMPLEIVGFAPYRRCAQLNVPATANVNGPMRLYVYCHRCTYEGKARVRVNGSEWIPIQRSTVSLLNQWANTTYNSLDFGQSLLEFFIQLPAGSVRLGSNHVEWEYWQEKKEQSGYRILSFGLFRPNRVVTSVAIENGVATLTTQAAHNFNTGDDVRVNQFNGAAWRVNGIQKNITVTGPNTFSFPLTGDGGKRNGNWQYEGVSVALAVNDFDEFTWENPASWTAPAGTSIAQGQQAFQANTLLAPGIVGENITASCNDCHAHGGRDLKYFNYSNWSNIVRSQFHGLSEQDSKNIAAYIRANASIAPGRPYIPPYQPAPCADTVDPQAWAGCASLEDILPFDYGMYDELFGDAPSPDDFSPSRTDISFRTTRISIQLPDWNDWLPVIHPKDYWNTPSLQSQRPGGYFSGSELENTHLGLRQRYAGYCPGSGCAARIATDLSGWIEIWSKLRSNDLLGAGNACASDRPSNGCPTALSTAENGRSVAIYSTGLWVMVKLWELTHEFDLERHLNVFFPGAPQNRGWPSAFPFAASTDLSKARIQHGENAGLIPGIFDGSPAAETTNGIGWYHLQGAVLSSRGSPGGYNTIQPLDVGYMYGKFRGLNINANLKLPFLTTQLLMLNFQRYINNWPNYAGEAESWIYQTLHTNVLIDDGWEILWAAVPAEDRFNVRRDVYEAATQEFVDLACGVKANGTAPLFTPAMWHTHNPQHRAPSANSALGPIIVNAGWGALVYGTPIGLSSGLKNQIAACWDNIWKGPATTLSGSMTNNQTTVPLASTANWADEPQQVVIGSERINCAGLSGSNLTGCTRGADGTTPATHSSGATVQRRIRWDVGVNSTTCQLQPNGMNYNNACYSVKP